MSLIAGFIGPAYRVRTRNMAAEVCRNRYIETIDEQKNVKRQMLVRAPGITLDATAAVPDTVSRGNFSQDGRTWTVIGGTLYERTAAGTLVSCGAIANDGRLCTFASNGRGGEQLAICGAGRLYVLNLITNALTETLLPLTNPAGVVDFIDGYLLLTELDSLRTYFTHLEDFSVIDALDFFAVSQTSSNVVGIKVIGARIWVLQSQSGSVYYDSGDADNPFVPYPSTVMQEGLQNRYAVVIVGETLVWLSQDNQGFARVVQAQTPTPNRISTPAIEFALSQAGSLNDAEMYAYEQEGHAFAVLTCPSLGDHGQTWVYDDREKAWHERSSWDSNGGFDKQWRVRGICNANGTLLVGDWNTANVGVLDLNVSTEYGETMRSVRRAPFISAENQWLFIDQIEMGLESGVGVISGQGLNPELMLSISRDSGHSWSPPTNASFGVLGAYNAMPAWRRLGRVRADRFVLEISETDPVGGAWGPGIWMRAQPGTGQV